MSNLWTQQQAAALAAGKTSELGWANLAGEIERGKRDRRALGSALDIIVLHLLKLVCQPECASRRGHSPIIEHRRRRPGRPGRLTLAAA
jgi:hypothetical protein